MGKDVTMECLINPERGRGEEGVSGTVLFCPGPGEVSSLGRYAKELSWQRHFLYNSNRWSPLEGGVALCGPAVGAPMAVLTLEKLIALGCQRVVVFGSCGALLPDLAVGDVFMPTWAVSEEGTSCHYPLAGPATPSMHLHVKLLECLQQLGVEAKTGGIWTTDAPYRERRDVVRRYQSMAVGAVDMEFSALLTVASFRQVELAAVMVVSDLLSDDIWRPGFRSRPFKAATARVAQALFSGLVRGQF